MMKLSMRNSILIWVSGACLGWVVLVVSIYTILGTSDAGRYPNGQMAGEDPAQELNEIAPAAGNATNRESENDARK